MKNKLLTLIKSCSLFLFSVFILYGQNEPTVDSQKEKLKETVALSLAWITKETEKLDQQSNDLEKTKKEAALVALNEFKNRINQIMNGLDEADKKTIQGMSKDPSALTKAQNNHPEFSRIFNGQEKLESVDELRERLKLLYEQITELNTEIMKDPQSKKVFF